jgi:hypothetical protein
MENEENVRSIPVFEFSCGRAVLVDWVVEPISTMARNSIWEAVGAFDEAVPSSSPTTRPEGL